MYHRCVEIRMPGLWGPFHSKYQYLVQLAYFHRSFLRNYVAAPSKNTRLKRVCFQTAGCS